MEPTTSDISARVLSFAWACRALSPTKLPFFIFFIFYLSSLLITSQTALTVHLLTIFQKKVGHTECYACRQLRSPTDIDDYVHRIGRTGRAGNTGIPLLSSTVATVVLSVTFLSS